MCDICSKLTNKDIRTTLHTAVVFPLLKLNNKIPVQLDAHATASEKL